MKLEIRESKVIDMINYCLQERDKTKNSPTGSSIKAVILKGKVITYNVPVILHAMNDDASTSVKLNSDDYYVIAKVDKTFNDKLYANDVKRFVYDLTAKFGHTIGTPFNENFISIDDVIATGSNNYFTYYAVKIDRFDMK